jgi:nitrite reductase (NO-forming)
MRTTPWISLAVTAALAAGLTGCGTKGPTSSAPSATPANIMGLGAMNMGMSDLNQPIEPMTEVRHGQNVTINMYTEERVVTIAPGVRWAAWTFDGTVPGPVIQLDQGDHVTLILHNIDPRMPHSIDLHAAQIAPSANYVDVLPGQSRVIHFVAEVPGVFMYHCATQPDLLHMEKGMYGEIIVNPDHTTPVTPQYHLVQSEFYANWNALLNGSPTYVTFNGVADQYLDHPLTAKVGQPVQFAVVNAGPNEWSAFHIIGAIMSSVQPSGSVETVFHDLQTYSIAPGDGALITVTFQQPGTYKFLTHSFRDVEKGAVGEIVVTP